MKGGVALITPCSRGHFGNFKKPVRGFLIGAVLLNCHKKIVF